MLPVDQVRSEPPLEDPEAFAKVRSKATDGTDTGTPEGEASEAVDAEGAEAADAGPAEQPAAETAN